MRVFSFPAPCILNLPLSKDPHSFFLFILFILIFCAVHSMRFVSFYSFVIIMRVIPLPCSWIIVLEA